MKPFDPGLSRFCAAIVLLLAASACSADSAGDGSAPDQDAIELGEPAPDSEGAGALRLPEPMSEALGAGTSLAAEQLQSGDDSFDKAGCSIVQFCRHPDDGGTRCVASSACSCGAAIDECAREAVTVCGTPHDPFLIVGGQCG
jgi:hypothetical protein